MREIGQTHFIDEYLKNSIGIDEMHWSIEKLRQEVSEFKIRRKYRSKGLSILLLGIRINKYSIIVFRSMFILYVAIAPPLDNWKLVRKVELWDKKTAGDNKSELEDSIWISGNPIIGVIGEIRRASTKRRLRFLFLHFSFSK